MQANVQSKSADYHFVVTASMLSPTPQTSITPSPSPTVTPIVKANLAPIVPTFIPLPSPTVVPTEVPLSSPTVLPVVAASAPSPYESLFDQYSSQYGVDKELMKKIARCESGYNPGSRSANGLYGGMYQFAEQTWISTRNQMARDTNPELRYSAADAIETAAFKISHGGINAWAGCL